ncbi:hypothetical protein DS67_01340 [Mesotoga sp. SC_4PWA21]|nr:hypothetical protein DS67_01340 [Mesotoga sp. SC_4PWA21]
MIEIHAMFVMQIHAIKKERAFGVGRRLFESQSRYASQCRLRKSQSYHFAGMRRREEPGLGSRVWLDR